MRPTLVLLALVVLHIPASAQLQKHAVRTVILPSAEELQRRCASRAHIYACTAFEQPRMKATCESASDGSWRMHVSFDAIPVMYLWNAAWIPHEFLHIDDVSRSLKRYAEELQARRYGSLQDCHRAADAEPAGFQRQLSVFIEESNRLRHPELFQKRR